MVIASNVTSIAAILETSTKRTEPKHVTLAASPAGPRYSVNAADSAAAVAPQVPMLSLGWVLISTSSCPSSVLQPTVPACAVGHTSSSWFKTTACSAQLDNGLVGAVMTAMPKPTTSTTSYIPANTVEVTVVVGVVVVVVVGEVVTVVVVVGEVVTEVVVVGVVVTVVV